MFANIIYLTDQHEDNFDYGTLIITISAADVMDMNKSGNMLIFIKTLIAGGAKKIVFDMEGLEVIDSSGISLLIETANLIRQNKGDIALFNAPLWMQKVFDSFKLQLFIHMYNNRDAMINFFRYV